MELATWSVDPTKLVLATAIHDGHQLRPEVGHLIAVDEPTRLREEDPWTAEIAAGAGSLIAVHRSRFEVDLNRTREASVYLEPDDAWGLELWSAKPSSKVVDGSRLLHDDFYRRLKLVLDDLVERHGGFVLFDVHSYNHRRNGPDSDPEPEADNPTVNLGTASLPDKWKPVAHRFLESIRRNRFDGEPLDARANVKFGGGHLSAWVNERYAYVGCALAVEFKKVYMNEWTNQVDPESVERMASVLGGTVDPVLEAFRECR